MDSEASELYTWEAWTTWLEALLTKKTWMFVLSLVGLAVSAALLILLIPSLFHSGEQAGFWTAGVLAFLAVVFAVGTRYWRPSPPLSHGGQPGSSPPRS